MKRTASLAAKMLGLIPPALCSVILLLLLLGAWGSWAFLQTQRIEAQAADHLAMSVRAIAEATNAPFGLPT
jgi:hypothetical protein